MKFTPFAMAAVLLAAPSSAAVVILDFGATQTGVWTDATLGRTYNAVNVGGGFGIARPDFYTSASLTDVSGVLSGWGVSVSKGTAGDIGAQPITNAWTGGNPANAAAPFTGEATDALRDGYYINNGAQVTISFSGLTIGQAYNLAAFGALSTAEGAAVTTTPANFILTVGTSSSTKTQELDLDSNPTSGLAAIWNAVTPDSNGVITLTVGTIGTGSRRTELNAVRLEAVPEPSTYGLLGAGALAGVAMLRRRRRH